MNTGYSEKNAQKFLDFKKGSFDWLYLEMPLIKKWLQPVVNSSSVILDVGCGVGTVSELLIDIGASPSNIVANDISQSMIDIAKARLQKVTFICEDASHLKIPKGNFDLIVSSMTLHYLNQQQFISFINNAKHGLKENGILFFIVMHPVRFIKHYKAYFSDELLYVDSPWGKLRIFPKKVEDYINPAIEAGLNIQRVIEPQPEKASKYINLKSYGNYTRYPTRLCVIARKHRVQQEELD